MFRLSKKSRDTVPWRSLCIGEELLQTECLIVYYISQAAKVGHPVAKEAVASLRNLIQVPGMVCTVGTRRVGHR